MRARAFDTPPLTVMPKIAAETKTAEQLIDACIQRAPTSRVVIDLKEAGVTETDVTPDLLGKYHTAGWRVAELKAGTLTLSN